MEVVNTVGRRKAAVARVYVKPGKGNITINRRPLAAYFPLEIFQYVVKQPLLVTNTAENFDITINSMAAESKVRPRLPVSESRARCAKSTPKCVRF